MFSPLLLLIKNLKKLLPLKVNILFEKHADKFPDRFHLKKKILTNLSFHCKTEVLVNNLI